ncbi:MAG: threonine/serine dehydratase [Pseudomonadota bacterium]
MSVLRPRSVIASSRPNQTASIRTDTIDGCNTQTYCPILDIFVYTAVTRTRKDSTLTWKGPELEEIKAADKLLDGRIVQTPITELDYDALRPYLPERSKVIAKLELFQHTGSFKARGAQLSIDLLDEASKAAGVVTASAGNHAIALSWAARKAGIKAVVVMPETVDQVKVATVKQLGGRIEFVKDLVAVFEKLDTLSTEERLSIVHPYDAKGMILGASTCGLELITQVPDLDVAVVPVGGGALIGGISSALKRTNPRIEVIGIEPTGANVMSQSLNAGHPTHLDQINSIADSLGAPKSLPLSFGVVQTHVDDIVTVVDEQILEASALMFSTLKVAVEPACAAALAGVCGPLRERLEGKTVGVIACGSNISPEKAMANITKGAALLSTP